MSPPLTRTRVPLAVGSAALAAAALYLCAWPVPVAPQVWTPPPDPGLNSVYAPNAALKGVKRILEGEALAPFKVAADPAGRVYTAYADGRLMRLIGDGTAARQAGSTRGRPLGFAVTSVGGFLVADARAGFVAARKDYRQTLLGEFQGRKLGTLSDAAYDERGREFYFLEATPRPDVGDPWSEWLEHAPAGRLFRYAWPGGKADVLLDKLAYPGALALAADGDSLLIGEAAAYRVIRYWLRGERAGQTEVFLENLPGYPIGISWNGRDTYWIALYGPRVRALDAAAGRPFLRKLYDRLPRFLQPRPSRRAMVLGVNAAGHVVHNLQYAGRDAYAPVTSAVEADGWLYLSSPEQDALARIRLAKALGVPESRIPKTPRREVEEED